VNLDAPGGSRTAVDNENDLRALRDAAGRCDIRLDAEGRIVEFNAAASQLFAVSRDEALGRPLAEVATSAQLAARIAASEARLELDTFSHTVAHDLRAPLRHIEGFARLLEEDRSPALGEKATHYLDVISRAAKRMALMLEDLVAYSRAGRAEVRVAPVSMGPLVAEVIAEKGRLAEGRNIAWEVADLPPARGDRTLVRQVWSQLVDNAVKFTRNEAQARISISAAPSGADIEYCIRDNGAGFDMQYAGKLFGVFHRLHHESEFEGLGIGLALARRILLRMGGKVSAEGEVGKGACVCFTLPAAE
jgi:light-regulated signal transduction histidine kinase (bacteriophytochrome)